MILTGCATHTDKIRGPRELFYSGRVEQAAAQLEKQLAHAGKDRDAVALDLAAAQLFANRPKQAEQTLREVRDHFDYLEQKDLGEAAFSYLTDDTRRAYAGEDYEKILVRVYLALANLLGDGQDAGAYSLQVGAKQQAIIEAGSRLGQENPKASYQHVAVGPYLHGILREATHANYDDAQRSFATVVSWQPNFAAGARDLRRAQEGRHSAPGNGVLYVFGFVGRGPYKVEVAEVPSSQALLLAGVILSSAGKHTVTPNVAPIKVPNVVATINRVDRMLVNVDGQPQGVTETITDVSQLAIQQYQALYPHVVARAVARRAVKKAALYAAKEGMHNSNPLVELGLDAVGVAWEATEAADTRCWALLPASIQVLRIELPAGTHAVGLSAARGSSSLGPETQATVTIEDGRNTYALACCPDARIAGHILVSQQP